MLRRIEFMVLAGLLAGASSACADDKEELQKSLTKWEKAREVCEGNYSYKVYWFSFTGSGHETEVIVNGNQVSERRFRAFDKQPQPDQPGEPAPKYKWIEKGKDLGKHQEGAEAKTLDELYEVAAKVVERELSANERRYVLLDKQGLLTSCYTVDTRIADDAPIKGVVISSISLKGDSNTDAVYNAPNGKAFPKHWGQPPLRQTRDLRPLPGDYGRGSSTFAKWIEDNLKRDAQNKQK